MKITDEGETKEEENKQTNKQTKTEKNKGGTEAIIKGWKLNDFVMYLS